MTYHEAALVVGHSPPGRLVILIIGLDTPCLPQPPVGNLADPSRLNRFGCLDECGLTFKVLRNAPVQTFGCVFFLILGDERVPRGHISRDGLFTEDVLACPQGGENNVWLDGDRQGDNDRVDGGRVQQSVKVCG